MTFDWVALQDKPYQLQGVVVLSQFVSVSQSVPWVWV